MHIILVANGSEICESLSKIPIIDPYVQQHVHMGSPLPLQQLAELSHKVSMQ